MLGNFKLGEDVKVEARSDSLGGAQRLESDIYDLLVDMIYIGQSPGGAYNLTFRFVGKDDPNLKYSETIYFTNKAGEPTYADKKDGSKRPLPGFTQVNELLLAICNKELHEIETQKGIIKEFDFQARAEKKVEREVLVETLKLPVKLAILKQIENKQVKDTSTGKYVNDPSGETIEKNVIRTAFRYEDSMSVAEMERGAEEAQFHSKWLDKFQGQTIDKSTPVKGGAVAGAPATPGAAAAPLTFD